MNKKILIIFILVIILFLAGCILFYNIKQKIKESPLLGKEGISEETNKTPTGENKSKEEKPAGEINISSGGTVVEGGGGGGGGATGGGAAGGSPAISDTNICQNAQNDNLCNGLDLTYGQGYKDACCTEHNLCC